MAEAKKPAAPRKPRAKKAAVAPVVENEDAIVVLTTSVGFPLVIRANPSDESVRSFVEEHTRRYIAGEPGGPSGIPPYRIFGAKRYSSELVYLEDGEAVEDIDIADLLPT